jgi:hypothetical protein
MSGPGPYGPGRRSEPREAQGRRREPQYGPDISWPNGFRQLDDQSRRLLESGYGRGAHDHADPGYGTGRGAGSRAPATDDYGDPGYSDPAYDGPRGGAGGRGLPGDSRGVPGYQVPGYRGPSRPDLGGYQQGFSAPGGIYPVTGAQEALPGTGPQPTTESWPTRDPGSARPGRSAYPDQWYGHPRLDDSRDSGPRLDDPRDSGPRAGGRPASDPRLDGMRYDELRYDEPLAGGPGYDEPLDDDAWVEELRRGGPAFPRPPSGPSRFSGGPSGGDSRRGSGYGQQSAPGQSGWGQQPGLSQPGGFGYGQSRDDLGGPAPRGPRLSAAPSAPARDRPFGSDAFHAAPTAQVGVLTPPAIRRLEDPLDTGPQPVTKPASQVIAPQIRPGHGLDGPEITSSWPAQPQTEDAEAFEEFWAEDDNDADYHGLFPGEDPGFDARRKRSARTKTDSRRIGRRRGRSNDHRLWLALLGVLVVAGAAIFGILKFEFPSHGGPTHRMAIPARIGGYVRTVDMEKETKVNELRSEVIKMSSGEASNVGSAVYESGNSAAGSTEQIVMFIGGHLANAAPASSVASFTQKFTGATVVSAGPLGGKAACVEEAPGTSDSVAMCVWFDNDSFGEIVSPTMNANALAGVMRTMRPSLELVVKK